MLNEISAVFNSVDSHFVIILVEKIHLRQAFKADQVKPQLYSNLTRTGTAADTTDA